MVARRWQKVVLVAIIASAMLVAWRLGFFASFADPRSLAESLRALGVMGWVLFVVTYALLQPFGVRQDFLLDELRRRLADQPVFLGQLVRRHHRRRIGLLDQPRAALCHLLDCRRHV